MERVEVGFSEHFMLNNLYVISKLNSYVSNRNFRTRERLFSLIDLIFTSISDSELVTFSLIFDFYEHFVFLR